MAVKGLENWSPFTAAGLIGVIIRMDDEKRLMNNNKENHVANADKEVNAGYVITDRLTVGIRSLSLVKTKMLLPSL